MNGAFRRARSSHHSVYRRRRHRARHLARERARVRRRRRESLRRHARIDWLEVLAGEKAFKQTGNWLPDETLAAFRQYLVGIKGPLTTPVGGGIRSLNVALRQELDLYVCLRPVRYFAGMETPVKRPDLVDMVIFRENTEDIYAGIEVPGRHAGSRRVQEDLPGVVPEALQEDSLSRHERHRHQADLAGGQRAADSRGARLRGRAQAQEPDPRAQGQHHEVHRRRVPRLGLRPREARVRRLRNSTAARGASCRTASVIKDVIADAFLQQILTRPAEYDVIATLNLNGDYISDALAAQVGGIGIAPGGNINYVTGHAVFEATHGTAPKYANLDKVNPGLGDPVGRDDVALHGLDRGRRPRHRLAREDHRQPRR